MISAFSTGFFLGLSLIIAIGSQNVFVLRQGLRRQHVFCIALFCSISDAFLIILGVTGISYFFNNFFHEYSKIIFGLAALWLFTYGIFRLNSAIEANKQILKSNNKPSSLLNAISIAAVFTFFNPHVYLDTMILIGSISQQFVDINRVYFVFGACIASFVWFFSISFGAQLLAPIMQTPKQWRVFDILIAAIMFIIAFNLASQGGWL